MILPKIDLTSSTLAQKRKTSLSIADMGPHGDKGTPPRAWGRGTPALL